jgi:hypothetical protein
MGLAKREVGESVTVAEGGRSLASSAVALIAVGFALLSACGGGDKTSPTTPTGSTSPTPTPSPTASPTPVASPGLPAACNRLPPATGATSGCRPGQPLFLNQMRDAVAAAQAAVYRDPNTGQTVDVVQDLNIMVPSAYLSAVASSLNAAGLCGAYDGEEMSVRQDSLFNEHYDIVTSDGRSWNNYVVTCNPAVPIPTWSPAPNPPDPTCKLPPSGATFCRREQSQYDGDVYGALDEVIAEDRAKPSPVIFDFSDRLAAAPEGWKIKNHELYVSEVLKKIKAKGYCATSDGDEFSVKRGTNIFSENHDLVKAEGYSIRLYIVTCRDAQF